MSPMATRSGGKMEESSSSDTEMPQPVMAGQNISIKEMQEQIQLLGSSLAQLTQQMQTISASLQASTEIKSASALDASPSSGDQIQGSRRYGTSMMTDNPLASEHPELIQDITMSRSLKELFKSLPELSACQYDESNEYSKYRSIMDWVIDNERKVGDIEQALSPQTRECRVDGWKHVLDQLSAETGQSFSIDMIDDPITWKSIVQTIMRQIVGPLYVRELWDHWASLKQSPNQRTADFFRVLRRYTRFCTHYLDCSNWHNLYNEDSLKFVDVYPRLTKAVKNNLCEMMINRLEQSPQEYESLSVSQIIEFRV
jgi:hypothetical protein